MEENYLQKKIYNNFDGTHLKKTTISQNVAVLLLVFFGFQNIYGQSNDCATSGAAGQLTVNSSCTPVTFNSTNNTSYWNSATGCNSGDWDDAWGWFDATSTITTINYNSTNDAILHLFTGTCASTMTALACVDANVTGTETITYATTIGVRYMVRIQRYLSNANMNGTICVFSPPPPTITNLLTSSSGCVGSNITITGTNLTGATAANVRIGGTPVSSITSNNGTTIVAVVGAGTTGTVSVTTAGGTATSVGTFTVNPLPLNPSNPISDSPQCNPPGVTLTRAAAPPITENYYWQTISLGTNTGSNGSTFIATTSGTYYIRSQNIATGCWSAGQGSLAVVVSNSINTLATTPSPSDGSIGVCYAGTSPISSISWTAAAGATSYDVYFGAGSLPGSVTSNVTTTTYITGTLLASTTYYWRIVPKNACGITSGSPITWTFTTNASPCICIPTSGFTSDYISNFSTTGGITNISNASGGLSGTGYGDFYAIHSASQFAGSTLNFSETYNGGSHGFSIWVDFNNNGSFEITERLYNAPAIATGFTGTITIPLATLAGDYRMRIRAWWNNLNPDPCTSISFGEAEDYKLTVLSLTPCTTPTAQPTALNLSVSGTTINGTFTAASPAPNGYLIVRSSSATPPTLTNGTTYPVGFTGLTPGTTNVIQGSAVTSNSISFSDSGLSGSTQYYYHVFSYNSNCAGGPFYQTIAPLTNNATTCISPPTAPVNSAITGSSFTVTWSASAGAINYALEVYTNAGYTIPIAGSPFLIASPTITYNVTGLSGPITYYYRIKANNGSCDSSYLTGSVTTLLSNDECTGAIPLSLTTTCNYLNSSNVGATASTGIPAPGCASYSTGDVWFSAIVPLSGQLTVDLQAGSITDSGMAFYSGTCGTLTLLECDDDDSINGAMSNISMTGLTPGQTIYIRVWDFSDGTGTFGICATTPSCPSPSDLLANILSTTSVTVNWNASVPPASGGYQYFINTTGVAPIASTVPTGTTAPGVIGVTLTGLTPGLKYYFWVRSFCGGVDTSAWFGPTNYTPCAVGNGSGTTTLDCPSVLSGGLGLSGGDPPSLSCQALTCVDLEATYLQLNQPTNYSVASIPYAPPYQFTCLQNPVSVNVDDIWSPMVNLPFNFCFYGTNFNRCLIGSNGVITFDTTTYAPGGYNNWSFSNDLPNATLFRNTIFGVYQDIDPSKGGQVGWELITLNTGCRALVAAWNDIPMFSSSCNSQLYTGMIVLYENTNVIEVYIKEKNTCATWNSGNAIVGIQNAAGTAAVVAPNRNGLSPDWSITNEAWRFTPTGTSLTTLRWFQGNGTSGPLLGTSNTINVCPTVTTTYTAEVTYALCSGTNLRYTDNVVVTVNGNKIWNGTQGPNWNINNNWTPSGVPTSANCVIIPTTANNPVISSAPDAVGYNLLVNNGAQLTMNSNQNLTITDRVTVQPTGVFTLNNSASLIQINNILNSGNIIYKRDSPNIRTLDYVYWSSPVAGFNVSNIVLPFSFGGIFKWNTTLANTNGGQGVWQSAAGEIMTAGKGYIARAPGTAPFNNTTFNVLSGTFTGVPNNGNISIPIERGNDQNLAPHFGTNGAQITNLSDNWNLIGNPYPSAIRASQFLFDNNTKIEGNVRLWTHGTLPSVITPNPFYGSFLSNYTPGDYLTYNFTGTSCCPTAASDIFIGAGQGFFVQMVDGPAVSTANNITVDFNNNLRNATFSNSTFYRNQNATTSATFDVDSIERNRIWLDFITPNNQTDRILFGYIENATNEKDSFFDCITQNSGAPILYSLVDDTKFSIQGRALPFDVNDEVPLGYIATAPGNYTIGITAVDGLFNNQNIYLKDTLLDNIHDIKAAPYTFTTQSGEINNRFKIVYVDNALSNPTNSLDNTIKVMVNNEVAVSSSNLEMESIIVYNLLGQKLDTYDSINSNFTILSNLRKNNTTLLLKIKLQSGDILTKKIIY
jgi:hypothetical protein